MRLAQLPPSERPRPIGMPVLRADERLIGHLAAVLGDQVAVALREHVIEGEGYLNAEAAGRYIGATRKRIHDLTSAGRLVPDGHDGCTPLYLRRSLDAYVQGSATRG
jgi:hypothetical protein